MKPLGRGSGFFGNEVWVGRSTGVKTRNEKRRLSLKTGLTQSPKVAGRSGALIPAPNSHFGLAPVPNRVQCSSLASTSPLSLSLPLPSSPTCHFCLLTNPSPFLLSKIRCILLIAFTLACALACSSSKATTDGR